MSPVAPADQDYVSRHRQIWAARPELRSVYQEWFSQLLACVEGLHPVVELGSGPGFFKEYFPDLIATDVIPNPWIDVVCDACLLPFATGTVGALVMVDVLHHLHRPLQFLYEAARVLRPAGRLAMIEPWITPLSYLLYQYWHHEDCCLHVDLRRPFGERGKKAFEGNAAIPFKLLQHFRTESPRLRLIQAQPFLGLPYLASLGFQRARPLPRALLRAAKACECFLGPLIKLGATRILIVWERTSEAWST
jgi:SAM-dependent methyltransferase